MSKTSLLSFFASRAIGVFILSAMFLIPLAGCELSKNYTKADRSSDMEVQDYRDALAPRLPDISDKSADEAGIPELKPYMATPSDKLKPMPLVSLSVNQGVPLKDVLYELAEQADYDLELDPRIRGSVIFSARNRPFDEVIEKLSASAGLRYKFDVDSVKIELDTPYHEIYKVNYLAYVRTNTSSISNNLSVTSGEAATGSQFKADAKSEIDFWTELDSNLTQILAVNNVGTLLTKKDPKITNVAGASAPVEPVLLSADGELAGGAGNVQVAAPNAVLNVEPLAIEDEEEGAAAASGEADPFQPRYSINKQAGMISVFANERLHKQVSAYLDMLRKSVTSQVLIEAKVLEVNLTDEFAAGIDWGASSLFGNRLSFGQATSGGGLAPGFIDNSENDVSFLASYISGDLSLAVQALARFGTVRALASPRLTVLNNQSAVLNVARNQVYFTIDVERESGQDGAPDVVTFDTEVNTVPEGVVISVQPSIDLDNRIVSMAVRPSVTRIVDNVADPLPGLLGVDAESLVPVVNIQEFDSVLQMNNGQAIVLGGLIQDRTQSTQNSVPVLGEIPVFGSIFRNQTDSIGKTELVVFLKATIVEGGNNIHATDKDMYRSFSQDRRPLGL